LIGAFTLSLAMRLIRLGAAPLLNMEAEIALQALAVARHADVQFGPYMTVVGLAGFDFFVFSAGNFLARFWPAFFSALIIFLPHFFRKQLGIWPAAILSVVLAISPEMVGLSRIIGSPMMAAVCLLLMLGFVLNRNPILAGLMLALGLMSGPGFWIGAVILGGSVLISDRIFKIMDVISVMPIENKPAFWVRFVLAFVVTILTTGTGFFLAPAGLSGVFSGLVDFINGFFKTYPSPYFLLPFGVLAYASPAIFLGIWGSLRSFLVRNKLDMFLVVWWLFAFIFLLLYPGSQPADMIWVTLPLWVLSARVLYSAWHMPDSTRIVMIATSVIVIVISAFMAIALRSLVLPSMAQSQQLNTLIALAGGMVLVVAIVLMVSFGWSEEIALAGLLTGLVIVFCVGMISLSVNSTSLGPKQTFALWFPDEPYLSTEWLTVSIDRIKMWNNDRNTPTTIVVAGYESAGLKWSLRSYDPVQFVPVLASQSQPDLLITGDMSNPELASSYRGQGLLWAQQVQWEQMSPMQYLNWLITRDAPTEDEQIIFWVRTDLMPDDQFSP